MTCQEIADFLSDYLNGGLPRQTVTRFEGHLASCPDCVAYLKSFAMTIKLAKASEQIVESKPPEDLIRAILSARKAN